jgi:RecJ-like exonuclease
MDYWEECIREAFEDAGIVATDEQVDIVAGWVDGAHENYGLATGREFIPHPLETENKDLKRELEKERDKVVCPECKGKGYFILSGIRTSYSTCRKCKGEGKR